MGSETDLPFDGCYQIDDLLLAGPYPAIHSNAHATIRLRALLDAGVDLVVDLTESYESARYGQSGSGYESQLRALAAEQGRQVEYRRFGFQDMSVPDPELMIMILDAIDQARAGGRRVYLHCWGGVGRTGTVVGCWLARHGHATGSDVLRKIKMLRAYDPRRHLESPQTREQCDMVVRWERDL
jgi:hypothetical protein